MFWEISPNLPYLFFQFFLPQLIARSFAECPNSFFLWYQSIIIRLLNYWHEKLRYRHRQRNNVPQLAEQRMVRDKNRGRYNIDFDFNSILLRSRTQLICRRSNHPPSSRVCWDSMRVQQLLSVIGMEVARIRTPGLPTRFSTLFSCNREEGGVYSVFRTRDGSYSFDRLLWTCTLFKLCFLLLVLLLLCCKYFDTFPRPGMYQNFVVMWIIRYYTLK